MRFVSSTKNSKVSFYLLVLLLFAALFCFNSCQPDNNNQEVSSMAGKDVSAHKVMEIIAPGSNLLDSPTGGVVLWLPGGEQVTVLESAPQMVEYKSRKNYWYRVRTTSGREGWVWGDDFTMPDDGSSKDIPVSKTGLEGRTVQELVETGNGYLQSERPSEALPYFIRATEVAPTDSLAFFLLGLTYQQLGQDEKAVEPYKQAIKLAPKDFWAHNNLGLAYIRTKQYEKAVDVLEKTVKLTPPSDMFNEAEEARTIAIRNLATAYRSLGRMEEAEKLLASNQTDKH
jgi:tetratricopeptide (TPR) repeat protein